jgi:chitodextrinase
MRQLILLTADRSNHPRGGARSCSRLLAVFLMAVPLLALGATPAHAADTTPPSQPGAITVSSVTATTASLKWAYSSDNDGVEGYRIYRGPANAADTALSLISTTDAVNSYIPTNLRSGYAYKFGVVAIDAANNKSVIRTTTLTTSSSTDTTPPAAPSLGSVALTAFSSTRIDIMWAASTSTDVSYYEVARDGQLVGTVERPNAQRYSDNGLAPATTHSYTIKTVDSAGNRSAATSAKSAKTTAAGVVKIARGPYLSVVTGTSAIVSWWNNIPTAGSVTINGRTVTDPAGTIQHHAVAVSGLAAGTTYPYTVTSGTVSATGSLRTAAPVGQTFSFAGIGDFGGGSPGEQQNANNIAAAGTQFIQTLGDNIYPAAGLPDPDFTTIYSDFDGRFYKQFGPVLKSQAFFPANGNKEYYGDGAFWNNFPMPGTNHSWYSYNWGSAHLLVLDSEQPMDSGSEQYAFAQADLAAHQSDPWRIVALQRPPYSSTTANSSSTPVRQYLVPLFQQQKVDLVLSGNSHNYERTYPLINGNPVSTGGTTYIVSGGGGNGFNAFQMAAPAYSAYRQSSYSEFVKVTVSPVSIVVNAIRADTNTVDDTTTISRGDTVKPTTPTLTAGAPTQSTIPLSWTASTDNVGVTGYEIYRDGAATALATVSQTSYTDQGLTAGTSHTYLVKARDAAGNTSDPSNSVQGTTTSGTSGTSITLAPTADATIDPASVTSTSSRLKVDGSAPVNDILMKFTIPPTCTPTAAILKLTVGSGSNDPSARGGDFYATSATDANASWSESSVSWATAPAKSTATPPVSLAAVTAGTTYSINVTTLISTSSGPVTIRGSSTSGDGAGYFSKEGSSTAAPALQVTCT